jgi:transposase
MTATRLNAEALALGSLQRRLDLLLWMLGTHSTRGVVNCQQLSWAGSFGHRQVADDRIREILCEDPRQLRGILRRWPSVEIPRRRPRVRVAHHRLDVDEVEALRGERPERVPEIVEPKRRHVRVLRDRCVTRGLEPTPLSWVARDPEFWPVVRRLRAFRGIDTLSALIIVLEVASFERFPRAVQLGSWLGLVPSRQQSGESDVHGSITKTGSKYARRILVEAAWHYARAPAIGRSLSERQEGLPDHVLQIASRAQRRLYRIHRRGCEGMRTCVLTRCEWRWNFRSSG